MSDRPVEWVHQEAFYFPVVGGVHRTRRWRIERCTPKVEEVLSEFDLPGRVQFLEELLAKAREENAREQDQLRADFRARWGDHAHDQHWAWVAQWRERTLAEYDIGLYQAPSTFVVHTRRAGHWQTVGEGPGRPHVLFPTREAAEFAALLHAFLGDGRWMP